MIPLDRAPPGSPSSIATTSLDQGVEAIMLMHNAVMVFENHARGLPG